MKKTSQHENKNFFNPKQHTDDCYKVHCGWNQMIVVFHPDLYSDYFTFADDECAPEWNPEYEFWVLSMVKNF